MDIKDIHSFMECYERRSINKAAGALFISPQGLGKILDRLERELRVQLFDRTKQGLIPTDAGNFLYEKGQRILTNMQELEQGLESIRNKRDSFYVGYSCGLIRMLPMKKMEQFQSFAAETDVVWEEASNQDIKNKLMNGKLDVALFIGRVASSDFVELEMASKTMCAVVPKNHGFFERESICIKDLKDQQLICLNEKYQSYSNLLAACEREGFFPNIKAKTMEAAMIYEFVEEGVGIGIDVDIHSKKKISSDVRLIPINDGIPWVVYLAHRKERKNDKLIEEFMKVFS